MKGVMRVLHVISSVDSRAGGPAVAMAGLCKAQVKAGLSVAVLATMPAGSGQDIADDLRAGGVDVTLVGPMAGSLSSHADLPRAMDASVAGADVVHIHALWETVQHQAARSSRRAQKPYIFTPHGMLTPWSLGQKSLKKKIYLAMRLRSDLNHASAIHLTSAAERELVTPLGLKPKVIVEPLGVDLAEFQTLPPQGSFRGKHPTLAGKRIIMFLGRLHPGKGMEYLIPAVAQAKLKDTMLVAVGPDSGGFQKVLEALVDQYGVRDQVLFTGMLRGRDRVEALTDADLFALPSEHENFGVAVVEALACGVPVLVSDGVALKDEITAAGVGLSVPVDIGRVAMMLNKCLTDDSLWNGIVDRAREFVWKNFDWKTVAAHWVDHYRGLVS